MSEGAPFRVLRVIGGMREYYTGRHDRNGMPYTSQLPHLARYYSTIERAYSALDKFAACYRKGEMIVVLDDNGQEVERPWRPEEEQLSML